MVGIGWKGFYYRQILLDEIRSVRWISDRMVPVNLVLHLSDESSLWLAISGAALWRTEIERHAPNLEKPEGFTLRADQAELENSPLKKGSYRINSTW